jgi:uncharacterized protein YecE (DUF72 family)
MSIYIGTCGFSYSAWDGLFYPPGTRPGDRLNYYADRFQAVELDSTFYNIPAADQLERMAKKTRKEFRFAAKLHRSITHEFDLSAAEFAPFRDAVQPLAEVGKLGAVLAQFPPAFHCTREAVHLLRTVREELPGLPMAVEFRHESWDRPETETFLRKHGIVWCAVDAPARTELPRPDIRLTGDFAYIRLHGRNADRWFEARSAAERHNYLYSPPELDEWAERIAEAARQVSSVYVLFSNVHEAKAVTNARQLAQRLGVPIGPSIGKAASAAQTELAFS